MVDASYEILRGVDEHGNVLDVEAYKQRLLALPPGTPLAVKGVDFAVCGDLYLLNYWRYDYFTRGKDSCPVLWLQPQEGTKIFGFAARWLDPHRFDIANLGVAQQGVRVAPHRQVVLGTLERTCLNEIVIGRGTNSGDFESLIPYVVQALQGRIPVDEGPSTDVGLLTGGDVFYATKHP